MTLSATIREASSPPPTSNSADYSYAYDAIGNRAAAVENSSGVASRTEYRTNNLNQYTAEGTFHPTFDADGNQTLIKTSTGIRNVTYNAKNRPILFTKSDGSIVVECTYDTMGRRATKKVTTNGTLTEHRRFLYRGYLQIACCDLTRAYTPALWYILWESLRGLGGGLDNARSGIAPKGRAGNGVPASHPTQPTATRPLTIQKNGTWYTYGWDLTKNICETYRTDARIDLAYTYTPYGEVSPAHTYDQPLRWSSEYHDTELGLVYYNYRHYNPAMGRWMGRDMVFFALNLYDYLNNNTSLRFDVNGLYSAEAQEALETYNRLIRKARKAGYNHAADNLEYFLDTTPERKNEISVSLDVLYSEDSFMEALDINHGRMKAHIVETARKLRGVRDIADYWDRLVTPHKYSDFCLRR